MSTRSVRLSILFFFFKQKTAYERLRSLVGSEMCIRDRISTLKRAFGLDRCKWAGWSGFKQYVWSSIVSYNLLVIARTRLARA